MSNMLIQYPLRKKQLLRRTFIILIVSIQLSYANNPTILVGTAWLRSIILELSDNKIDPVSIVPPTMCPGHFDIKPDVLKATETTAALIIHNWQTELSNLAPIIRAAKTNNNQIFEIKTSGNFLVPETQIAATQEIAFILSQIYEQNKEIFEHNAQNRICKITNIAVKIQKFLLPLSLSQIPIVCQKMQVPFANWLGFKEVIVFDRFEDPSAATLIEIIKQAQNKKAKLLIDNLQSTDSRIGNMLAKELNIPRIVLSNFPGINDQSSTWENLLIYNVSAILESLGYEHDLFSQSLY